MIIAYISDQKYYFYKNSWYTTASFPLDEYNKLFSFVTKWILFGRLYELNKEPKELYKIPVSKMNVTFFGVWNMPRGLLGYMQYIFIYLYRARKTIINADILWLKLPFIASSAILFVRNNKKRIAISHLVGHPILGITGKNIVYKAFSYIIYFLTKKVMARCDLQVFVSNYLAREFSGSGKTVIVANESRICKKDIIEIKEKSIKNIPAVLYVGRLSPEKGLEYLIRAIYLLTKMGLDIELNIVGDGPLKTKYKSLVYKIGISDRVNFIGYIKWGEQLFSIMRACDFLILPSLSEGLPLVIIEAMSQGLPVIASKVGGIIEIIIDGYNGILIEPSNIKEIAGAILLLMRDDFLRLKIIRNGIETAKENTLHIQIGKIVNELKKVL